MNGKPDAVHSAMKQVTALFLISIGLTRYWSVSTRRKDNSVNAAFIISRLFGALDLLLIMAFQYWRTRDMSLQHLTFFMLAVGLWFVGNLMQLLQFENLGRRGFHIVPNNNLSKHILVDLLVFGFSCVVHHCQPSMFFDQVGMKDFKGDTMHLYMVRVLGALILMTLIYGTSALYFENEEDKRNYLLGRVVLYATVLPLMIMLQLKMGFYKYPLITFSLTLVPAVNSFLGYYGCKLPSKRD